MWSLVHDCLPTIWDCCKDVCDLSIFQLEQLGEEHSLAGWMILDNHMWLLKASWVYLVTQGPDDD